MWYICLYPQFPHLLHLLTSLFFVSSVTYVQLPLLSFSPCFLVFSLQTAPWHPLSGPMVFAALSQELLPWQPQKQHLLLSHCAAPQSDAVESSCSHLSPYRHFFPSHEQSKSEQMQSISSDALISTFSQRLTLHHLVCLATSNTSMKEVMNCRENYMKKLVVR